MLGWPVAGGGRCGGVVCLVVCGGVFGGVFLCCPFSLEMSWMRSGT